MGYRDFDASGTRTAAILIAVLVVVTFVVGAAALGGLEWLHPEIGHERAALERERARELQIKNDRAAEALRHEQAANQQSEQSAAVGLTQQKAFSDFALDAARDWSARFAQVLPGLIFVIVAAFALRWVGVGLLREWVIAQQNAPAPKTAPAQISVPALPATSAPQLDAPAAQRIVMRQQDAVEKERRRAERELARQREREALEWRARLERLEQIRRQDRAA